MMKDKKLKKTQTSEPPERILESVFNENKKSYFNLAAVPLPLYFFILMYEKPRG